MEANPKINSKEAVGTWIEEAKQLINHNNNELLLIGHIREKKIW
jgi:hypothetical protein